MFFFKFIFYNICWLETNSNWEASFVSFGRTYSFSSFQPTSFTDHSLFSTVELYQQSVSDTGCDLCKFVVNYLDDFLKKNSTEASIEALLSQVCGVLPDALKSECSALVKQYGPLVISLLEQELQADQVCKALGLCNSCKGYYQFYGILLHKCIFVRRYCFVVFHALNII